MILSMEIVKFVFDWTFRFRKPSNTRFWGVSGNFEKMAGTKRKIKMKRAIFKHTLIRFLILAISYFSWFAVFAEFNYKRQPYNADLLILFIFFFFCGLIIIETFWYTSKNNKPKYLSNILLLIFFTFLYFILPHRTNFN